MNIESMIEKSLLIVTDIYPDAQDELIAGKFVKNQVNELMKYFKEVNVIVALPSYRYYSARKILQDYSYENVHVYFIHALSVPLSYTHLVHIDFRYFVTEQKIQDENIKFDIIHAHHSEPSGYIAMRLKEKYNVPYVVTIHENGIWFEKEMNMSHPKIIGAWKSADALIRVNPFDIPILKEYNNNSFYIANGYSPSFHPQNISSCRNRLSISQNKKILFGLGILTERKGFQYLIEAMTKIAERHSDVLCYIGGDGPYREYLENMIQKFNLEKRVFLLGRLDDKDLPIWMNACDLFVLPSLGEGNPTVMFEALGCGKPFIGTRVGGIPSVINKDDYGLLCDPGDVAELILILEKAILCSENEGWDRELIVEYSKQFTWNSICKELISVYELIS